MEHQGRMGAHIRCDVRRSGLRIPDHRFHHRPGASARRRGEKGGSEDQALGRSRGGLSTKIHMAVRGLGCPVRFTLTAGHKADEPQAAALIEGLPAEVVMADTAYDDKHLYAQRHLVECCFSKLKQFRRVATRFEKTARNYRAVVTLAAIVLWMR